MSRKYIYMLVVFAVVFSCKQNIGNKDINKPCLFNIPKESKIIKVYKITSGHFVKFELEGKLYMYGEEFPHRAFLTYIGDSNE